jgi:hypothetical protein
VVVYFSGTFLGTIFPLYDISMVVVVVVVGSCAEVVLPVRVVS